MEWYSRKGCGGQGLVIDEETGRTVAVAYDGQDAGLLGAAPRLLEVCRSLVTLWEDRAEISPFLQDPLRPAVKTLVKEARAAVEEAKTPDRISGFADDAGRELIGDGMDPEQAESIAAGAEEIIREHMPAGCG